MKVLLTGVTGYVGKRLLVVLIHMGYEVICVVRDQRRLDVSPSILKKIKVVEADFLKPETLNSIPKDIDIAYYLIHSMSNTANDFESLEQKCAQNFKEYIQTTQLKQVIYLSGITNDKNLSIGEKAII